MAVVADGRPSRTEYRVLERFDRPAELALLECRLETGRTHQIRVHLSSINHPLVGDPVYGQRRPKLQVDRPFLHASELAFEHPTSGEQVDVPQRAPCRPRRPAHDAPSRRRLKAGAVRRYRTGSTSSTAGQAASPLVIAAIEARV